MFSYIYMKALEAVPRLYDKGINMLSFGQSGRVIDTIVSVYIEKDMKVLDIGCGTGTFAVKAAVKGARVTGIDISDEMLGIARKKVGDEGLEDTVELVNAGVLEMDGLFGEKNFDCVVSILVFSELSRDERTFALRECHRVLKDGGILIIADETRPQAPSSKALYNLLRAPLAGVTYLFTGEGTKALPDLEGLLTSEGFLVREEHKGALGAFTMVVAEKGVAPPVRERAIDESIPLLRRGLEPFIEYLFRWFPLPVEPGLRKVGNPGPDSPVLVTANYSLSVKRLRKKIADLDCYILVAPTGGINNWCSSADGIFNAHAVYSAFKTSRIEEVVENRQLVLPQLSAPGVSRKETSELTGWKVVFGPVYATDIPEFVDKGFRKTPEMHVYRFQLHERLDLALSMNFIYYLPAVAAFLTFRKKGLARFSLLFWSLVLSDYLAFFALPTRYGWTKAMVNGSIFSAVIAASNRALKGSLGDTRKAVLACMGFSLMIGMDLAGITGVLKDEPLLLLYRLGIRKMGPFTVHPMEVPRMDEARCVGCGNCYDVCPRGVYLVDDEAKKSRMVKAEACEMCRACVMQCPEGAITIKAAPHSG